MTTPASSASSSSDQGDWLIVQEKLRDPDVELTPMGLRVLLADVLDILLATADGSEAAGASALLAALARPRVKRIERDEDGLISRIVDQ